VTRAPVLAVVLASLGACASFPRSAKPPPEPALAGWSALGEGRRDEASRIFAARLTAAPGDPIALFGQATIAGARGESRAALDADVRLLRAVAAGAAAAWADALAPVAAARVRDLFDEIGVAEEAQLAAVLRPGELARAAALPWAARFELARLAEEIARRAEDPATLAREAAAAGFAPALVDAGRLGPLAHLDLQAPEPAAARDPARWRAIPASGGHVDLAPPLDGRADARLLRAAVELTEGTYEVIVEDPGEAWLSVDGLAFPHGSPNRYGPRITATRLSLSAGRHELGLRVATSPGETRLTLAILPDGTGGSVRFVQPHPGGAGGRATPVSTPAPPGARAAGGAADVLRAFCAAFLADRLGAVDEAAALSERLTSWPRFALGWALAGDIARHDPTVPAPFARDAARRALRAAVAIDPSLARAWQTLATVELEDDRPRDAIDAAGRARTAAPRWWAPELMLARVLALRGLDFDAAAALSRAALEAGAPGAPCVVLEALRRDAEERRDLAGEDRLIAQLAHCGGSVELRVDRARARGQIDAALAMLGAEVALDPERDDLGADRARLLVAAGRPAEALRELGAWVAQDPADAVRRVRLADAQVAAGQVAAARQTLIAALATRPDVPDVRRAARALGVPLPLDAYRIDGRAAIREFEKAGRARVSSGASSSAPAVIALDRDVTRIFPTGATMTLTHEIVRVDSKDAIDRFGEIAVPAGADILTLRTHKPDGTTREPEEIAGKETVSAPDLQVGDYVEWELLETHPPAAAFAPGFLADRFYFQSFDAPIARSELTLIAPAGLPIAVDARAGAPRPAESAGADGTRVMAFVATGIPQLFAERSAVPAVEYVPSVRASSGVSWAGWARYLTEQLHDAVRVSPAVRGLAAKLREAAGANAVGVDQARLAAAVVDWVTSHVEATDELTVPAGVTLARGRGSRVTLALALAGELGLRARPVLARSRLIADGAAPVPAQELDDFADTLVAFDLPVMAGSPAAPVYADLRLRHATIGYVPPGLDGARTLSLADGSFGVARSRGDDSRTIDMTIRLDERGGGVAFATEDLSGWPALEWAELLDRFGGDRDRLREDFEQRWLGVQFPGARLRDLEVDLPRDAGGRIGRARVRYSFIAAHLAVPVDRPGGTGREMRIAPTFFRSQPGRRFAAEPQRSTALVLGFDVPTRMTATVELPGTARLDAAGRQGDLVVARAGGYRFLEARDVEPGRPNVIVLRRESTLPIMRVAPDQYAGVAADLRRVDGAEQAEIRIRLAGPARGAAVR
jgi:cellulose synthase operon protein C